MTESICPQWSNINRPVIGMIHLPALPGSPGYPGDLDAVREHVVRDAKTLQVGGVHGLMIENFGDVPFFPDAVPTHTLTHMTAMALAVREQVDLPLGINVLRNDAMSALAIAHAVGASYIRVNVLSGACLTDQGVITGKAAELMRYRQQIGASGVKILADVRVKHAAPLAERPIEQEAEELLQRAGADALIISGEGTGKPTDPQQARVIRQSIPEAPIFIGSGVTPESLSSLAEYASGFIVGSCIKPGGRIDQPVDPAAVASLMQAWQALPTS